MYDGPNEIKGIPVWFKAPKRFTHRTKENQPPVHPFFDLSPFPDPKQLEINFVPISLVESKFVYSFDMVSGKRYFKQATCEQQDIWKKYDGEIDRSPYTSGIVPRFLDSLGKPLEILVFGDRKYAGQFHQDGSVSYRTKVVGGLVYQKCDRYPCTVRENWMTNIVLIGVNVLDSDFSGITDLKKLKDNVDWEYVEAFFQNGKGISLQAGIPEPAYRIIGYTPPGKALGHVIKNGDQITFKEQVSIKKGCYKLYDHLWNEILELRRNINKVTSEKFGKQFEKSWQERSLYEKLSFSKEMAEYEKQQARKKKMQIEGEADFSKVFRSFHKRFSKRYKTCLGLVRRTNIGVSSYRHWFFAYFDSFFLLEDLHYKFDCSSRIWKKNPMTSKGKMLYGETLQQHCDSGDFDEAFRTAPGYLHRLGRSHLPNYKYVEFDSGVGGSHQKIFNWVYQDGKKLSCNENVDDKKYSLFFRDIPWNKFSYRRENKLKVIR